MKTNPVDLFARLLGPAILVLGFAVTPGRASAEEVRKDLSHTFPAEEGAILHLEHHDGNVEIIAWDRPEIAVRVVYEADVNRIGVGGTKEFSVHFRYEGKDAWVTGHEPGAGVSFGFFAVDVHRYLYTVQAPPWVELELDGDDGSVSVAHWRASVDIDSDDGDLRLQDIEADFVRIHGEDGDLFLSDLRTELKVTLDDGDLQVEGSVLAASDFQLEDGDLRLRNCEGNIRVRTEDGDLDFDRVAARDLSIRMGDGTAHLSLVVPRDLLRGDIQSEDGDIILDLDSRLSVGIEVRSRDGRIQADLPSGVDLDQGDHTLNVRIGAGEGRLRVSTEDGLIRLSELATF